MSSTRKALYWSPVHVAKLMADNNIGGRAELAGKLDGVSYASVYRAFDEYWSGKVTVAILAAMSTWTDMPLPQLVGLVIADPRHSASEDRS